MINLLIIRIERFNSGCKNISASQYETGYKEELEHGKSKYIFHKSLKVLNITDDDVFMTENIAFGHFEMYDSNYYDVLSEVLSRKLKWENLGDASSFYRNKMFMLYSIEIQGQRFQYMGFSPIFGISFVQTINEYLHDVEHSTTTKPIMCRSPEHLYRFIPNEFARFEYFYGTMIEFFEHECDCSKFQLSPNMNMNMKDRFITAFRIATAHLQETELYYIFYDVLLQKYAKYNSSDEKYEGSHPIVSTTLFKDRIKTFSRFTKAAIKL